jgi:ABC-type sugar transport system permease subunit
LWQRLAHITVPWLRPLLITIALLLIGDTLGTFDSILILTGGGPGTETITPGLYSYQQAFQRCMSRWRSTFCLAISDNLSVPMTEIS